MAGDSFAGSATGFSELRGAREDFSAFGALFTEAARFGDAGRGAGDTASGDFCLEFRVDCFGEVDSLESSLVFFRGIKIVLVQLMILRSRQGRLRSKEIAASLKSVESAERWVQYGRWHSFKAQNFTLKMRA